LKEGGMIDFIVGFCGILGLVIIIIHLVVLAREDEENKDEKH